MIHLTLAPSQDNWLATSWFDVEQLPDVGTPATPAPGETRKTEVKHTSYHPTQLALLQADAAAMGTTLDEHEAMLSEWVAAYVPPPPHVPTALELQAAVVQATQQRLDDFARTRNYDGILSACTYASSTVPQFFAEGKYAVRARDTTWAALYQILAQVQAGAQPMPSGFAEIEPELPPLEWPA